MGNTDKPVQVNVSSSSVEIRKLSAVSQVSLFLNVSIIDFERKKAENGCRICELSSGESPHPAGQQKQNILYQSYIATIYVFG